ncbi:MAG: FG-GAP-like repeat-containing protein [Pyrinomonadaceae bacterium]|nr:FG-GAP-like repeat-containing protein [Pyrinomonadaceae bacterium]
MSIILTAVRQISAFRVILFLLVFQCAFTIRAQKTGDFTALEEAYRANNRGVSLLEQFKPDNAEREFRRALEMKPDFKLAKINLAIALFNSKKFDEAKVALNEYLKIDPNSLQAFYVSGLTARSVNETDEALEAFQKVLKLDPNDVGANVNAGQLSAQKRDYPQAIRYFETAIRNEPFNLTAIYGLAISLQRSGERERAAEYLKKFQTLRDTSAGVNISLNYLEQGRYSEAISSTGAEEELIDKKEPQVAFRQIANGIKNKNVLRVPVPGGTHRFLIKPQSIYQVLQLNQGGGTLIDFDRDGDLDVARIDNSITDFRKTARNDSTVKTSCKISLYRNEKGKFSDVSQNSGDLTVSLDSVGTSIIAGDFDNDDLPDLLVIGFKEIRLYRNEGKGKFKDVSSEAKFPKYENLAISTAFVDYDHDGDLDIFIAGFAMIGGGSAELNDFPFPLQFEPAPNLLLRNNNNGNFTDVSAESKINQTKKSENEQSIAVVPTDFNNTRDADLLILNHGGKPTLLSNQRDDTFKNAASAIGLSRKDDWSCVAAGDVNKDGFTDFFFGLVKGWGKSEGKGVLAISDGTGKFILKDAPNGTNEAFAAQFLDYDNDGLLDLLVSNGKKLSISRNLGSEFAAATAKPFKNFTASPEGILSADFDRDGDLDLLVGANYLRNDGGSKNNSVNLDLQGRVSNKSGVGTRVLMRSGSLEQQLDSYSASPAPAPSEIHFGLGRREKADSLKILWSSGIIQSETEFNETTAKNYAPLKIQEVDRKPSSCPYLYVWNGEKFEFITDFLGGGEMGNWAGKGVYHFPDSDEFIRIAPDKIKAKDGFYEIRVTNELEEVLYLDKVKLVAVEHDADAEVYPNEGLGKSEISENPLFTVRAPKPPVSALNSEGKDVLPKIRELDRVFYDDFRNLPVRGYAETHSLTLKLDDRANFNGRTTLLLTGWTDYAFSSDNVNASQSERSLFMPYLQVKNEKGEWQTVIESIGIPVGRPQTVPVDLTGKFLSDSREIRIVTNFKTFWDKISVDTSDDTEKLKTVELEPEIADLRERGFSKELKFGEMIVPEYEKVSTESPWKSFSGNFTRFGDVKPLLDETDDLFVISKTGDEFVLKFKQLDTPEQGKTYTFLLFADGYSKEMDINSGSPNTVFPLPFKGMKKYPYDTDEVFPMTEEKRRVYEETLTRRSRGTFEKKSPIYNR